VPLSECVLCKQLKIRIKIRIFIFFLFHHKCKYKRLLRSSVPVWKYICKDKFFFTIQHCNCPCECKHARLLLVLYAGLGREMTADYDHIGHVFYHRGPVKSSPRYKRIRHLEEQLTEWRWGEGGGGRYFSLQSPEDRIYR
jgi:hypothetical protein